MSGSTCDRAIVNISHIREFFCNSRYRAIVIPARGVIPARRLVFNSASSSSTGRKWLIANILKFITTLASRQTIIKHTDRKQASSDQIQVGKETYCKESQKREHPVWKERIRKKDSTSYRKKGYGMK